MREALIIGIDLGTSGVKVEIYDEHGKLLFENKAGFSEQTVDNWINALKQAMPIDFLKTTKARKIVSVDSTSGTILVVDEYGIPLINPIMYYEKEVEIYNKIKDLRSIKELAELGVDVTPASPIPKILKIMESGLLRQAKWIISPTTWILYRLVYKESEKWKEVKMDYTNALKFGADITKNVPDWYKPLFEETGIPIDKMPMITGCGDYVGLAESDLAKEMGLYGAEVYQGMTDGNAAALAGGALKEGDLSIYGGTTVVPKYVTSVIKKHQAIYYHRHPIKGYLASAATSFTGGFLSWFAEKLFGLSVGDMIKYTDHVDNISDVPVFIPPGDRSPFNDPALKAAILGLYPWDEPREKILGKLTLSILIGIAFLEYSYMDLFEKLFGKKIEEVRLTGGTVKSRKWNIFRASIYEKPVKIYSERIGIGAVIPALLKSGLFKDINEIESMFITPHEVIYPDPKLSETLRKDRDLFITRWKGLQKIYRETSSMSLV